MGPEPLERSSSQLSIHMWSIQNGPGCDLGVRFSAAWSWTPNWIRSRLELGLQHDSTALAGLVRLVALLQVLPGPLHGS